MTTTDISYREHLPTFPEEVPGEPAKVAKVLNESFWIPRSALPWDTRHP
jgi:hypothetical protein